MSITHCAVRLGFYLAVLVVLIAADGPTWMLAVMSGVVGLGVGLLASAIDERRRHA